MLGNFSFFFCHLIFFNIIFFFEKFSHKYNQTVKQLGSTSGPTFCSFRNTIRLSNSWDPQNVGPNVDLNRLQRLQADQKKWSLAEKELRVSVTN